MLCRYPIDGIGCESSRETYVVYLVCIRVSCISILRLYFYYIKSPGCCYSWMGGCWRQLAWQQGSENLVFANSLQSGSSLKIHSFFFFFLFSPFSPSAGNDGLFPDRLEIDMADAIYSFPRKFHTAAAAAAAAAEKELTQTHRPYRFNQSNEISFYRNKRKKRNSETQCSSPAEKQKKRCAPGKMEWRVMEPTGGKPNGRI